jgi:uncharacterized membrane protein
MFDKLLHRHKSHPVLRQKLNFGQKAADALTRFAGSWAFILFMLAFIAVWIYLNVIAYVHHWDPWPFIILNLTLSCLAALQAPIILMSQNREAERDRIEQRYDYQVNRKAEREIQNMQQDLDEIKALIRGLKKK